MGVASAPSHAFLEFFQPVLRITFFPSHWLIPHITIVETTDSGERGMNPVAMTTINPQKEYWPTRGSNQGPPVLTNATMVMWESNGYVGKQPVAWKEYCAEY